VRIAAVRSGDVAPARPPRTPAPEPGLDIVDEADAEARRAERRRARAEARRQQQREAAAANAGSGNPTSGDDDRVVTIRANRTTPPTGDAELVRPPDRPPLRPAQPAAQPTKRRFGRNGR
jgi:hypothetical protein